LNNAFNGKGSDSSWEEFVYIPNSPMEIKQKALTEKPQKTKERVSDYLKKSNISSLLMKASIERERKNPQS
jgi:hypothetical protein